MSGHHPRPPHRRTMVGPTTCASEVWVRVLWPKFVDLTYGPSHTRHGGPMGCTGRYVYDSNYHVTPQHLLSEAKRSPARTNRLSVHGPSGSREKNSREKRRGKSRFRRLREELIADLVEDFILQARPRVRLGLEMVLECQSHPACRIGVGQQRGVLQEEADTSRIQEFLRINPPSFTGSSTTEDPKNFIEELQKVFKVMHVVDVERVELVAYQLKNVSRTWFDQFKQRRVEDAPILS
uniref:Gag-pol polyprotein n=1 Tax=Solanum tuberosum TaxID=4113 RepID=M1DC99_SOLTU